MSIGGLNRFTALKGLNRFTRTGMLEAKDQAQVLSKKKKKGLHKNFSGDLPKKKRSSENFQAISTKKRVPKNFSSAPPNFNNSKNTAVLETRTRTSKSVLDDSTSDYKSIYEVVHLHFWRSYVTWFGADAQKLQVTKFNT